MHNTYMHWQLIQIDPHRDNHGGIIMERPRGVNCVKTGGGRTVHRVYVPQYIEQKDCTARFATWAI